MKFGEEVSRGAVWAGSAIARDVGQVKNMMNMFEGAAAFDHDISTWAVGSVVLAFFMLSSCPIREAYMPHIGLTVVGMGDLGLSNMSVVCVDTPTGPIRVSLNKTTLSKEMREKAQDMILRYVCGFYATEGSETERRCAVS